MRGVACWTVAESEVGGWCPHSPAARRRPLLWERRTQCGRRASGRLGPEADLPPDRLIAHVVWSVSRWPL